MSIGTLFIVGILFIWLAVTGRAGRMITALTGGNEPTPTMGQSLPGVPVDVNEPIGMAQGFTGQASNPYAYPFMPPYVNG